MTRISSEQQKVDREKFHRGYDMIWKAESVESFVKMAHATKKDRLKKFGEHVMPVLIGAGCAAIMGWIALCLIVLFSE